MPCPDWFTIQGLSLELSIGWEIKVRVSKEARGGWMLDRPPTDPTIALPTVLKMLPCSILCSQWASPTPPPPVFTPSIWSHHIDNSFHFLTHQDKITGNEIRMKLSEDVRFELDFEAYQKFRWAVFLFNATDYKARWLERGELGF